MSSSSSVGEINISSPTSSSSSSPPASLPVFADAEEELVFWYSQPRDFATRWDIVDLNALSPFQNLATGVYLYDVVARGLPYANKAGLDVWRADSLEELRSRPTFTNSPELEKQNRAFLKTLIENPTKHLSLTWTFYPKVCVFVFS